MVMKSRRWRFHGLKKPKIRQDWNKWNLYNLTRLSFPNIASRTFFQQKWTAKASTRAYHGEHIKETQWKRMFDRRTPAVVPQNPRALAEDDGSRYSAGRGSGKELPPEEAAKQRRQEKMFPYMQMVYHPIERRLDTAIFRSLFSSSARQARQYVTHGHVKVNGKKMIYPGYMLNPGDMFQVDPVAVLQCTGTVQSKRWLNQQRGIETKQKPKRAAKGVAAIEEPTEEVEEEVEEAPEETLTEEEAAVDESDPGAATKKTLLFLRAQAVDLEAHPPKGQKLSGKQKQELRAFRKTLKSSISKPQSVSVAALQDLETQWRTLSEKIEGEKGAPALTPKSTGPSFRMLTANPSTQLLPNGEPAPMGPDGRPVDLGPRWLPKKYMSVFAFIPRYLEVNQAIMAAVYLRHPVCRPGLAEVPTPFHPETGQLAFNWYLRRR